MVVVLEHDHWKFAQLEIAGHLICLKLPLLREFKKIYVRCGILNICGHE
jgi:hypothetical protein